MRKIKELFSVACFVGFALASGTAMADTVVDWWYLQKRTYENGNEFNRLGFETVDGSGNYVPADYVDTVALYDPDDVVIYQSPPSSYGFSLYRFLNGDYDADADQWNYDPAFIDRNYYGIHDPGTLTSGDYDLVVTFSDGSPSFNDTQTFNGVFA